MSKRKVYHLECFESLSPSPKRLCTEKRTAAAVSVECLSEKHLRSMPNTVTDQPFNRHQLRMISPSALIKQFFTHKVLKKELRLVGVHAACRVFNNAIYQGLDHEFGSTQIALIACKHASFFWYPEDTHLVLHDDYSKEAHLEFRMLQLIDYRFLLWEQERKEGSGNVLSNAVY